MRPDQTPVSLSYLVSRYNDNPKNSKLAAFLEQLSEGQIEAQYHSPQEFKILKLPHAPLAMPYTKHYPINQRDPLSEFFGDLQPQVTQEINIGLSSGLLKKTQGRYELAESMKLPQSPRGAMRLVGRKQAYSFLKHFNELRTAVIDDPGFDGLDHQSDNYSAWKNSRISPSDFIILNLGHPGDFEHREVLAEDLSVSVQTLNENNVPCEAIHQIDASTEVHFYENDRDYRSKELLNLSCLTIVAFNENLSQATLLSIAATLLASASLKNWTELKEAAAEATLEKYLLNISERDLARPLIPTILGTILGSTKSSRLNRLRVLRALLEDPYIKKTCSTNQRMVPNRLTESIYKSPFLSHFDLDELPNQYSIRKMVNEALALQQTQP